MAVKVVIATILAVGVDALLVHKNQTASVKAPAEPVTFPEYYDKASGRGIWKWGNALVAYQRHFGMLAGKKLAVAEVGVQSGGSLLMWKAVLGQQIEMHGLDINPACDQFKEKTVSITIGDQADVNMWHGFFTKVSTGLDILVDDGGHEPNQMLTTLSQSWPHIHPGGYAAIEDITVCPHCPPYLESFFKPTAAFLAQMATQGQINAVHLYPMLLVVRKGLFAPDSPQASEGVLKFADKKTEVADMTAMWTAITEAPAGSQIVLRNPSWASFFSAEALTNFFAGFIGLHTGTFKDTPDGCSTTTAAVCTNAIDPLTHLQYRVSGVHIYVDHAVIEVPATPPTIAAVRKGQNWIHYGR